MVKENVDYEAIAEWNTPEEEEEQSFDLTYPEEFIADTRYNTPKAEPSVDVDVIKETIATTEIYRRAYDYIFAHQRRQVGYGLEKYPEPLNADTWSEIETIDHIIEESVDRLHYLVMLRIKLEQHIIKED